MNSDYTSSEITKSLVDEVILELIEEQAMNYRGQRFLGVRFPESGLNEWQPWPFRIEGFEYEPGYVYRLRIGTSVVPAPDSPAGYYSVRYSMLDMDRQPAAD